MAQTEVAVDFDLILKDYLMALGTFLSQVE